MSFLGGSPSAPKPKPLPAVPQQASFISRGRTGTDAQGVPNIRPVTPIVGKSTSRVGAPTLLGGT